MTHYSNRDHWLQCQRYYTQTLSLLLSSNYILTFPSSRLHLTQQCVWFSLWLMILIVWGPLVKYFKGCALLGFSWCVSGHQPGFERKPQVRGYFLQLSPGYMLSAWPVPVTRCWLCCVDPHCPADTVFVGLPHWEAVNLYPPSLVSSLGGSDHAQATQEGGRHVVPARG